MAYDLADLVPLTFTTHDAAGALADATTVTLTIGLPDGTSSASPVVSHTATGTYSAVYPPVQAGRHTVDWVATGTNAGGFSDVFDVYVATPGYIVSLADVKTQLNIADTTVDEELRTYIEAATDIVETLRSEAMVRRTIVEEHQVRTAQIALNWTPAVSLTSVVSTDGYITWDVNNLLVSPAGVVSTKPYIGPTLLDLFGFIRVVYVAGYSVVPARCRLAAMIIIQHLWQTKRGGRGAPRPGGLDAAGATTAGYAIPNWARELLGTGVGGFA